MGREDCHNDSSNLVLHRENVFRLLVISLGPTMGVGCRINQLSGNSHAVTRATKASSEHIAHTQLTPDLPDVRALYNERMISA
jgi:hypothetical protein